jgi:hypothetical protein
MKFAFLLNAAFAMAILDLNSRVNLTKFITLPKELKYTKFSSCSLCISWKQKAFRKSLVCEYEAHIYVQAAADNK